MMLIWKSLEQSSQNFKDGRRNFWINYYQKHKSHNDKCIFNRIHFIRIYLSQVTIKIWVQVHLFTEVVCVREYSDILLFI
jgi:hypothetical protein